MKKYLFALLALLTTFNSHAAPISTGIPSGIASGGIATPYMGVIATRSGDFDDQNNTSNHQVMVRQFHIARAGAGNSISQLKLVFNGWYAAEIALGAPKIITCSIEYPAGTFNQCKFSGSASGSVASGAQLTSDMITLSTPIPDGAKFWVRMYYTSTAGISYTYYADLNNDAMTFGASGVADQTMGGTVTPTAPGGYGSFEYAIIGQTNQPSVCMLGDSRVVGKISNGVNISTGAYNSEIGDSICPKFGCLNLAAGGEMASHFITNHTGRLALMQYCTHFVDNYGINDIAGGASAATLISNQATIEGYVSGKPFFLDTLSPETTSTDSWATIANQSFAITQSPYQAYNLLLRQYLGTYPWVTGIFDVDAVTESSIGTGKWNVSNPSGTANFWTADGIHPTYTGYQIIKNSGVVNTQLIHYP